VNLTTGGIRSGRFFHREADLERYLKVANLAPFNVTASFRDFEPSQIPDGLVRPLDGRFDSVFDAALRSAHELDHSIDMVIQVVLRTSVQ
jgi:hypothetical protein